MKRLIGIILPFIMISCEETIDWTLQPENIEVIVVDGGRSLLDAVDAPAH